MSSKYFHQPWALLPLLTVLSLSPMEVSKLGVQRSPDSIEEVVSDRPLYTKVSSKVKASLLEKVEPLDSIDLIKKDKELKEKLQYLRENFETNETDGKKVRLQKKVLNALVTEVLIVERDLKLLKEKNGLDPEAEENWKKGFAEHKDVLESLLADHAMNEALVLNERALKKDLKKEVKDKDKDEEKLVSKKEQKEKKENGDEKEKDEKKDECDDERVTALNKQVQQLIEDQKKLMFSMLSMGQIMNQQLLLQQQLIQRNQLQPNTQNLFQYHNPTSQGAWVYYPQGFQPGQSNIFQAPQALTGPTPEQYGLLPHNVIQAPINQQAQQPQGNWMLGPMTPGNFGPAGTPQPQMNLGGQGMNGLGFNLSPNMGPVPQSPGPLMRI